jgi:hypothetical protein
MPSDSDSRSKTSARRRIVQALWPLVILLVVFAWNATACKKKEKPGAGGRRGPHTPIAYNYPTPQPTYTVRAGVIAPTAQPE